MDCTVGNVQEIQLTLLKICRDICQRYGLTYFLFGDTLRGAVRNSGFLKDSTEAAILMPAGDLRNFCAYFEREAPKGISLSSVKTENTYPHLHVKLRQDGTLGVPEHLKDTPGHHGICVDIYPYYPMDVGKLARPLTKLYIYLAGKLFGAAQIAFSPKPSLMDKLILKIPTEKRRAVAETLQKKLEKGNKKSMQVCAPLGSAYFFWREALGEEETFMLSIADEAFRVPDRKEVFLNMTLPKEAEDSEMFWSLSADDGKGKKNKKKQSKK